MFIKEIELVNFKCHTHRHYHFDKRNYFYGDNYTGKTSIGEAIIFCLFGVTKHNFKKYVKDYLQQGKTSMKVGMTVFTDNKVYKVARTMNEKGTTKVDINGKNAKGAHIQSLFGDPKMFIYSFFPDVFPEESAKAARSFILEHLIQEKNQFEVLEKEKRRISAQQRKTKSSITFISGQKSVLTKQIETISPNRLNPLPIPEDITIKKEKLVYELNDLNEQIQEYASEKAQLQEKIKIHNDDLEKLRSSDGVNSKFCPTCLQTISNHQRILSLTIHSKKANQIKIEIESLENNLEKKKQAHLELLTSKSKKEEALTKIYNMYPSSQPTNENEEQYLDELSAVNKKLDALNNKTIRLKASAKKVKHRLGQTANQYQKQINQALIHTRIDLFKQLKNGELREDFQVYYKNRPFRVLSYSERIRSMLEIITLINAENKKSPLFLDNLESITHLVPPDTQIIAAVVKKGAPLTLRVKDY